MPGCQKCRADNPSKCDVCKAKSYLSVSTGACACLPGHFARRNACARCPKGRVSPGGAQAACAECPAGRVANGEQSECIGEPPRRRERGAAPTSECREAVGSGERAGAPAPLLRACSEHQTTFHSFPTAARATAAPLKPLRLRPRRPPTLKPPPAPAPNGPPIQTRAAGATGAVTCRTAAGAKPRAGYPPRPPARCVLSGRPTWWAARARRPRCTRARSTSQTGRVSASLASRFRSVQLVFALTSPAHPPCHLFPPPCTRQKPAESRTVAEEMNTGSATPQAPFIPSPSRRRPAVPPRRRDGLGDLVQGDQGLPLGPRRRAARCARAAMRASDRPMDCCQGPR